uniref:CSON009387 protein n=1 Tax=Culicoides sonorensis TaxID=179676 RepID=A0A336KJ30_CULSO
MSSMLAHNLSRFKLVTFDVTNTLLKFSKAPGVQYTETANSHGITSIEPKTVSIAFRKNFKILAKEYPNFGYNSQINWHEWWRLLVIQTLNDASSSKLDQKTVNKVAYTLIEQYQTPLCWEKYHKADELLRKVKETGKCVGIISNFDSRLKTLLNNMKFNQIDFILPSYEIGVMKPNTKIFEKALKESGILISPSEALHIGNEIELDCKGALDAGWSGILIRNCERDSIKENLVKCPMYDTLEILLNDLETKELNL